MNSYKVRPGWSIIHTQADELRFAGEARQFTVRMPGGVELLLDALRLAEEPSHRVERVIRELERLGVVMGSPGDRDIAGRCARQLEYFDAFGDDSAAIQARLERARLLLLGLGGTGSEFLRHMVGVGVRDYLLVDQDAVEESNFNRQSLYTYSDVGLPKVVAAQRYVESRLTRARCDTLHTRVRADDQLRQLIRSFDPTLLIVAIDDPVDISRDVAAAAAGLGVPFLIAGVGVRQGRIYPVSHAPGPETSFCGTDASLATTNAVVAALAAHRAVEFLSGTNLPFEVLDA